MVLGLWLSLHKSASYYNALYLCPHGKCIQKPTLLRKCSASCFIKETSTNSFYFCFLKITAHENMTDSNRVSIGSADTLQPRLDILTAVDGGYFIPILSNWINVPMTKTLRFQWQWMDSKEILNIITITMSNLTMRIWIGYSQWERYQLQWTMMMMIYVFCDAQNWRTELQTNGIRTRSPITEQVNTTMFYVSSFRVSIHYNLCLFIFGVVSIVHQSISNDQDPRACASELSSLGSFQIRSLNIWLQCSWIRYQTVQSGDTVIYFFAAWSVEW